MVELLDSFKDNKEDLDVLERCLKIRNEVQREGEFAGRESRYSNNVLLYLITYAGKDVGYIYFVQEHRYPNALFADMTILKEYRGKGIGTKVLNIISNMEIKSFLMGEVKKSNFSSNAMCKKVGSLIYSDGYNYYLLQRERLAEFNDQNQNHEFEIAMKKSEMEREDALDAAYESVKVKC